MRKRNIATENKLQKMRKIKGIIKEMQAEFNQLKSEVIENYFFDNTEYKTEKGIVLATYTLTVKNYFNTQNFREDYPSLYTDYQSEKNVSTFLLK